MPGFVHRGGTRVSGLRDIAAGRAAKKAELDQEREKLNIIAEMFGEILFEYDIAADCMHYTKSRDKHINDSLVSQNYVEALRHTAHVHPEDADKLQTFCDELQEGKEHIYAEIRNRQQDGKYHWLKIEGRTVCDKEGKPFQVIGRMKNIDERKAREEGLLVSAETDSLTGLYNHQSIMKRLTKELGSLKEGQSGFLLIVDIDNFKKINDTNGHLVGDAVICLVADELRELFPDAVTGRIGGDEYLSFVKGISREETEERLKQLNRIVGNVYRSGDKTMEISCSIGAAYCEGPWELRAAFAWADYALSKVKQSGKQGYAIESPVVGEAPEEGYLMTPEGENRREESSIRNADDLVLFSLELLGNTADMESSLKIISDRICSFFNITHIVYVTMDKESCQKRFHWNQKEKRIVEDSRLIGGGEHWARIEKYLRENGTLVLRQDMIETEPKLIKGSVFFAGQSKSSGSNDGDGCLIFVDEHNDRSWAEEGPALKRLADVYFNCLQLIFQKEEAMNEMEHRIHNDPLTGLLRYQHFISLSQQYLRENPNKNCYFIYSDFENFQYVNELYGYQEGDKILKSFADRLLTIEGGIYFCRITSDYFVGLLEGGSEEEMQARYLDFTRDFCARINQEYDRNNLVLVSGLCGAKDHKELVSAYIDKANSARKYAKDTTETVVMIYNQEIKKKSEAEKRILGKMNAALADGEFHAWLQPKVSINTGKIVGAEALVRWIQADGTIVYPDDFVPVFEKNGFITRIDFEVLDQILDYLRDAMDSGEEIVPVSVNFSRRHNENPEFVENLLAKLKERQIPPRYIEVEITESIFMLDLTTLTDNLRKLKDAGIAISIDDFGSGYSSLNVLANVDADIIKLDKKFLKYGEGDSKAPVFVKYLVKMMKSMGYKVISEGVETEAQLAFLKNADCDMVQGYYYARPMPVEDFRKFLKEFNR